LLGARSLSAILLAAALAAAWLAGCEAIGPIDGRVFRHHRRELLKSVEELTSRLYAKNPKYEPDPVRRQRKLAMIAGRRPILDAYGAMASNEILTEAFAAAPGETDRVYLLGLGLAKSIRETYEVEGGGAVVTGLQVPLGRLQRLHHNISQVNWRMKTYRDSRGRLLFLTNEAGEGGYINMGFEVLMAGMLTRIADDIYLRGGLPRKYAFNASTLFVSILF